MGNETDDTPRIVERCVWWKEPPSELLDIRDVTWGFLIVFSDGKFEFSEDPKPTAEEIENRKSCRL